MEMKTCSHCAHLLPIAQFRSKVGRETRTCQKCRDSAAEALARRKSRLAAVTTAAADPPVATNAATGPSAASDRPQHAAPSVSADRTAPMDPVNAPEPPPQPPPGIPSLRTYNPSDMAVSDREWRLIRDFQGALSQHRMETCSHCRERWLNMKIEDDVCARCRKVDKDQEVWLFGSANAMQPDIMPSTLPALTQVEEMLISRVHVFIEVRQIRGQQYRYRGHIVHFLRDTGRVYSQLPLLPQDLDIIVLQPSNAQSNPRMGRQFVRDFRVRRAVITTWLHFLRVHHPGYQDIAISADRLDRLPDDGDVMEQVLSQSVDPDSAPASVETDAPDDDDDYPVVAAVPNFLAQDTEINAVRDMLGRRTHLTLPEFRMTPINEFNRSQALLSLAFPTLFPLGAAEYTLPRMRSVPYEQYARHLMKHESGRLARHPRFRYVVFNTIMRHQASKSSGFYVRRFADRPDISLDELQSMFDCDDPESRALLQSVTRFTAVLRGTRPFWTSRKQELEGFVRNLGPAHLFVTLSAADLHWDDLMRHLPQYEAWQTADPEQRVRIARQNLRDNPHIVAEWYTIRFETFKTYVIDQLFDVEDWWNRYEWQGRGSTHNHGLYWINGQPEVGAPPDADGLGLSVAARQCFAEYWGLYISAVHQLPGSQPAARGDHPIMQVAAPDLRNTVGVLSHLVKRVQSHHCSEAYCLRTHKPTRLVSCRFGFPKELREQPTLSKPLGSTYYRMYPLRNDPSLNEYNPTISLGWLANTDITPCTGTRSLLQYLTAYASKHEVMTASYKEIMKGILPRITSRHPLLTAVTKLMNSLIAERDWSAQEVCHLLLDLPLQNSSREAVAIDCRHPDEQPQTYHLPEEDADAEPIRAARSKLHKYETRAEDAESVSYLTFLRCYYWHNSRRRGGRGAKPRVLSFYPIYKPHVSMEDYSRVKLMLHHPFRHMRQLLEVDGTVYGSFAEAYQYCSMAHSHEPDGYGDDLDTEIEELFEPADEDTDEQRILQSWELLAGQLPQRDPAVRLEDADLLGSRNIDLAYDWTSHVGTHEVPPDYWKLQKDQSPVELRSSSTASRDDLNSKQKQLHDLIVDHYADVLANRRPQQLLVNLDGRAGTGKSFVIMLISKTLQTMAETVGESSPIQRAAPTGVAAFGISGRTLHAMFRLPITKTFQYAELSTQALQTLQDALQDTRYLIIDEKSMIGLRTLWWIEKRCREIFVSGRDQPFGGLNVILAGDFYQLAPVFDRPLFFADDLANPQETQARLSYRLFDRTIVLDDIVRQQGDTQRGFRRVLDNLRNESVTCEDWGMLASRVRSAIPTEVSRFDAALRIYPTKAAVREYNHVRLRDLRIPVLRVRASHTGRGAQEADSDQGSNLWAELDLAVGSRIMLTENIWTACGLVNGAFGTVRDIVWPAYTTNPRDYPPTALLIQFDQYTGPPFLQYDDGSEVVPILRSCREFYLNGVQCSRTQFPITIAYAMTVHKAQGLTVTEAVLDICRRDFSAGLTYVAVSRVRSLKGVLFEEAFDLERFRSTPGNMRILRMRVDDALRRQPQHIPARVRPTTPRRDAVWLPQALSIPIRPRKPQLRLDTGPMRGWQQGRGISTTPVLTSSSSSNGLDSPSREQVRPETG